MHRLAAVLMAAPLLFEVTSAQVGGDQLIPIIEGPQSGRDGDLPALSLADAMKKAGVPGLSVAVIKDFEIHITRAYGLADVVYGATATPDTLFPAASISKHVAAMAVLNAVQDKGFGLDEDVNKILRPRMVPASEHAPRQPATLRGLLSHTSGTELVTS